MHKNTQAEQIPQINSINDPNFFLGQNPDPINKLLLRIVTPIYLKDSAFAYDLFEFKYNTSLKKYEISGLYYEGTRQFLNDCNFYKRQLTDNTHVYVLQEQNIIKEVNANEINDKLRAYVDDINDVTFSYNKEAYNVPCEAFKNIYLKQYHNIINNTWLTNLNKSSDPILKDTENTCFFSFGNGIVKVTKKGIETQKYDSIAGSCIWQKHIIQHDFKYISERTTKGVFESFINNVCNSEPDRLSALKSAIGYLLHNFFEPTRGQAVILYDEELTTKENPSGGTGKGLIVNALKLLRDTAKVDGKAYKSSDTFKWSTVQPSTQLVWIDETNKNFDFKDLFSCLTDGWQVERKHHNKFDIAPEDSPKVVICSNTILDNKGSSNKRRQFVVELSNYYSRRIITGSEKPIEDEHGVLFSKEWTNKEWNLFYSFMLECAMYYLENGLVNYERKNVELNLLKQRTNAEFMDYILNTPPPIDTPINLNELFTDFKINYLGNDENFKQRTFTNFLKRYCEAKNYVLVLNSNINKIRTYKIVSAQVHSLQ